VRTIQLDAMMPFLCTGTGLPSGGLFGHSSALLTIAVDISCLTSRALIGSSQWEQTTFGAVT
jgi:hypothetical protein